MNALTLIGFGGALFAIGLGYRIRALALLDEKYFLVLNTFLSGKHLKSFFVFLWPLGTSIVVLFFCAVMAMRNLFVGITMLGFYLLGALIEFSIKKRLHRPRPFENLGTSIVQPKRPNDPSFPSGDALRIWYLALILPALLGGTPLWAVFFALVALAVSLGRLALGVHHPLDVLAGAGLGWILAGGLLLSIG